MSVSQTIGMVGAGKMAIALAKGLVRTNTIEPAKIIASAPDKLGVANTLHSFKAQGSVTTFDNKECVEKSDIVFLMTKGTQVPEVLSEIAPVLDKNKLLISVVAGLPLAALQAPLSASHKIVRSMPNTPMLVGCGAGCYSVNKAVTEEDKVNVERLLSSCGYIREVPESMMNAVCGLSGSGPAYVYMFIDSLTDGGVRMGLPRELALKLATETVLGAAVMVKETGEHPMQLKDNVCSPGGSTITAVHSLDCSGFRGLVIDAVRNATLRTAELAGESKRAADKSK